MEITDEQLEEIAEAIDDIRDELEAMPVSMKDQIEAIESTLCEIEELLGIDEEEETKETAEI